MVIVLTLKHRYFLAFRRFEMTNQHTVSSWSCLSTPIYSLTSTVCETKTGERYPQWWPSTLEGPASSWKGCWESSLPMFSTHLSLCFPTLLFFFFFPSQQKKLVRKMCSLLLHFYTRFSTLRENSKFDFAQSSKSFQRHPISSHGRWASNS